jgi:hypothetical protein
MTEQNRQHKYRAFKVGVPNEAEVVVDLEGYHIALEEVDEPFILLRYSDPMAREALRAYAKRVHPTYPDLAQDIWNNLAANDLRIMRYKVEE